MRTEWFRRVFGLPWARWLSPLLFFLLLLCFLLPFASTSCALPGGYGRGAGGTATVYTGLDLAVDGIPAVAPENAAVRPGSSPNDGRLGVQPLAALALLAGLAGFALSVAPLRRRAAVLAGVAAAAALLLVLDQLLVLRLIADRIDLTRTEPLPAGKTAADYVGSGNGLGLALLLTALLAALNGTSAVLAWRRRPDAPATPGPEPSGTAAPAGP